MDRIKICEAKSCWPTLSSNRLTSITKVLNPTRRRKRGNGNRDGKGRTEKIDNMPSTAGIEELDGDQAEARHASAATFELEIS